MLIPRIHSYALRSLRSRHSLPCRRLFSASAPMSQTLPRLPIFEALKTHDPKSTVVVHSDSGRSFTYGHLLQDVSKGKDRLAEVAKGRRIDGERVAFIVENSYDYVVTFLSVLASNAIAVPLSAPFPAHELQYIMNQSQATLLLASEKHLQKAQEVFKDNGLENKPLLHHLEKTMSGSEDAEPIDLETPAKDQGGMMLYTSGTTSRPKGVLLTSSALTAQAQSLHKAWRYVPSDRLLHCLPLHHIHGTINALLTPLFAGSSVEFLFPFNADAVWRRFAAPFLPNPPAHAVPITFFTVVPTIYARLLATHGTLPDDVRDAASKGISPANLRLAISGSAALPTPTKKAWADISSNNVLLERYGMTEVGMALSCALDPIDRVDGAVGWPLPGVQARLVDTDTNAVIPSSEEDKSGEIQLRGPTVFREYWRNPEATTSEFVQGDDGQGAWFKTGDVAVRRSVEGAGRSEQEWARGPLYFIQGRKSADIIKTGGEKVSALEIEREMLSLPEVAECAVVGLENEQWGQKVAVVVVLTDAGRTAGRGGKPWAVMDMRRALKDRLANYKVPQEMKVLDEMPRNAMGKVNKKGLIKEVWG